MTYSLAAERRWTESKWRSGGITKPWKWTEVLTPSTGNLTTGQLHGLGEQAAALLTADGCTAKQMPMLPATSSATPYTASGSLLKNVSTRRNATVIDLN